MGTTRWRNSGVPRGSRPRALLPPCPPRLPPTCSSTFVCHEAHGPRRPHGASGPSALRPSRSLPGGLACSRSRRRNCVTLRFFQMNKIYFSEQFQVQSKIEQEARFPQPRPFPAGHPGRPSPRLLSAGAGAQTSLVLGDAGALRRPVGEFMDRPSARVRLRSPSGRPGAAEAACCPLPAHRRGCPRRPAGVAPASLPLCEATRAPFKSSSRAGPAAAGAGLGAKRTGGVRRSGFVNTAARRWALLSVGPAERGPRGPARSRVPLCTWWGAVPAPPPPGSWGGHWLGSSEVPGPKWKGSVAGRVGTLQCREVWVRRAPVCRGA